MVKTVVIGVDGATWDALLLLIKAGYMPFFKYLLKRSTWGIP